MELGLGLGLGLGFKVSEQPLAREQRRAQSAHVPPRSAAPACAAMWH